MSKQIQSILQPTLYMPLTMKTDKFRKVLNIRTRGTGIYRVVGCLEDSVLEQDLPVALANLKKVVKVLRADAMVSFFVRVRNPEMMKLILDFEGIDKIAGFVTPKADPDEFPLYAEQVLQSGMEFLIMPIMEAPRTTDRYFREALKSVFQDARYYDMIDGLRIGANDLMGDLGIRRDPSEFTVYQTPVGNTIMNIINEFRSGDDKQFTITAPVYEGFGRRYAKIFHKEIRQHIMNGLFGQTVIHTNQIRPLRDAYKVSLEDLDSARSILAHERAVSGLQGRMDEHTTHWRWAQTIVARFDLFGDENTSESLLDRM